MAAASAGPYANNLHHLISLQAGCSSRRPTNSVKAQKAQAPRAHQLSSTVFFVPRKLSEMAVDGK